MTSSQFLKQTLPHPIAFGGGAISGEGGGYGFGAINENDAIDLLHYAYEKNFRIFDTAPIYGFGTSELRMGKAFKNQRENVILISKSGVGWHSNKRVNMSNEPTTTEKMLHESLQRLQVDYIDLFFIHWPDANVDIRKPMEVLAKAKKQGKIKHIGLSNTNIEELEKARQIESVEVVQSEFNIFNHQLKESLFPYLRKNNIEFMSWGTLDKGVISGRVDAKRHFDENDARRTSPWWKSRNNQERFEKMQQIQQKLKAKNQTGLQLALSYNLSFPEINVVLCGPKNKSQVDSLVAAWEQTLPPEDLKSIVDLI